jgi:hypothetical protein
MKKTVCQRIVPKIAKQFTPAAEGHGLCPWGSTIHIFNIEDKDYQIKSEMEKGTGPI